MRNRPIIWFGKNRASFDSYLSLSKPNARGARILEIGQRWRRAAPGVGDIGGRTTPLSWMLEIILVACITQ